MKKPLLLTALGVLLVSGAALADSVTITSQASFSSPSGGSIQSTGNYQFKGPKMITFIVAGKTCNLIGSASGPVQQGCNYAITVAPDGSISGKLTAGNSVCTQSGQIASSCK
jgi:hypothetical protein